jgi:hypothetical protein
LLNVLSNFTLKAITDGLILYGGYYELIIVGLALATLTQYVNSYNAIYSYSKIALPLGIFLLLLSFQSDVDKAIKISHLTITNCFIPLSVLAISNDNKKQQIIGWFSILLILYVSSRVLSRSFLIVGLYLSFASTYYLIKRRKILTGVVILLIFSLGCFGGLFSFLNHNSQIVANMSILEKFQLDSLISRLKDFLTTGNLATLSTWEGNSRARVIEDAFRNFNFDNWMFGVGISGVYSSFVVRSTIEIYWAQETFRWGLTYIVGVLIIFYKGQKSINKIIVDHKDPIYLSLRLIILIKFLDGIVYGVPEISIYNLLLFWAIMQIGIKKEYIGITEITNR